jgi:hypothetical protein
MGEKRNGYKILKGNPKRNHLEDVGVDARILLKCILNRMGGCELDSSALR